MASTTGELEQRNRELSILNAIAESLNREVDLKRALQTVLVQVAELLDLKTSWIFLLDEETEKTYLAASHNLPPALADRPRRMGGACYCINTYQDGDLEGAANVNIVTCTRLEDLVDGTDGLRYHASIPLYAHGKKLGILNVASMDWRELSEQDLRLLYTVGDLMSIAVERARLFARSVQYGAMEERNRLAREIHDTLAQGLTAITLQLEAADALLEQTGSQEKAHQAVKRALSLTRNNLEEARRSVLDLRAAPLENKTLSEAIQSLVDHAGCGNDLAARFEAVGGNSPLPVRLQTGIYRLVQEAVTNVVQHADSENLEVKLIVTPEQVQVIIKDDGCGFDPQAITPKRFGLVGMNERVKLLGGILNLKSAPGAGTLVEAILPVEGTTHG